MNNLRALNPTPETSEKLIGTLLQSHCKLLDIKTGNKHLPAKDYSLDGLNIKGSVKLEQIIEAVRRFSSDTTDAGADCPRMNILLSGAPGTGKTEFVKHLGDVLRKKVILKTGSDILGMYVGQTEQRIRDAFAEAEASKAILFLD